MATRFGGVSPAQTYATKVRWIVGFLVIFILLLIFALSYIVLSKPQEEAVVEQQEALPVAPIASTGVDILVTAGRIEEGVKLQQNMFAIETRPPEQVPEGVIRAEEIPNILGFYAANLINANTPMLGEYVSKKPPMSALHIPPGYRAVTIYVDSQRGIEGWAKPESRVDVLWTFTDRDRQKKVATIVRYCKILSVGGMTEGRDRVAIQGEKTTVTLLVTERDTRKIQLAKTSGTLSLSLVGEKENVLEDQGVTDVIDLGSIIDKPRDDEDRSIQAEPSDGEMYTKDPRTGQLIRFELRHGRWRRVADD